MRKLVVLVSLLFLTVVTHAQQLEMLAHSFYKPMIINPAFTGSSGYYNTMLMRRMQWTGFNGAPVLNMFNFDGNFKRKEIGLGINLYNETRGISSRTGGNLFYAYRLKLNDDINLLFGISAGGLSQALNFSNVVVESESDPNLLAGNQQKISYDANAGLAFTWKSLELGLSVPQIIGNKIQYTSDTLSSTFLQDRHYLGFLKYKVNLNEGKGIALVPQAIFRYLPNAPIQFDAGLKFDWNDKFWVSAIYRSQYAMAANIAFRIKKHFYIGYSYDIMLGNIGKYAGLSHEVMLNFKFGKEKEDKTPAIEDTPIVEEELVIEEPKQEEEEVEIVEEENLDSLLAVQENLQDLSTLIILNLLKEIEDVLDNPKATSAQVLDLKMRISAFSNSEFRDAAMKGKVEVMTEKLKLPDQSFPDVVVKANIVLDEQETIPNYSLVSITVIDTEFDETVGTYTPNGKTGKFILILRPNQNYQLIIENEGYELYMEDITYSSEMEGQELTKEIKLIKE